MMSDPTPEIVLAPGGGLAEVPAEALIGQSLFCRPTYIDGSFHDRDQASSLQSNLYRSYHRSCQRQYDSQRAGRYILFLQQARYTLNTERDVPMINPTTSASFPNFLFQALRCLVRHHAVPKTPRLPKPMTIAVPFSTTARQPQRQMPSRPKPPPEDEIEEAFLKGSGPGGQKIVCQARDSHPAPTDPSSFSTATQACYLARHHPNRSIQNKTNSAVQLKHIPTGIVIKCQATRSREQNRKTARELLAARLDEIVNGDKSRSAIVGDVKKRRADSAAKKSRRKYRKLEEEKEQAAEPKMEPT